MPTATKIKLKKHNTLGRHGYRGVQDLPNTARHAALLGAVAEFGPTYVIRKLNVLAIFNKTKNPALSALFRRDIAFVQTVRNAAGKKTTKTTTQRTTKRAAKRTAKRTTGRRRRTGALPAAARVSRPRRTHRR